MHPYKNMVDTAFWSRSVSVNWRASDLVAGRPFLRRDDRVASLGSCFAANMVPYLEAAGFEYVREEVRPPAFSDCPGEDLAYDKFSAAYGNIYTARQLSQLLARCLGEFSSAEAPWPTAEGELADPLRPGLRYKSRSHREYELLTAQHLAAVRRVFERSTVVIFTLGLTEAWHSRIDGTVFPACPGTLAGEFDESRHGFINFAVADVVADVKSALQQMRRINNSIRMILSVSPVPLVATATATHVVSASMLSKSILRAACGELESEEFGISYFPSYEIITGPQAPRAFFKEDRRTVSKAGVEAVMEAFFSACDLPEKKPDAREPAKIPASPQKSIADIECEEAANER